MADSVRPADPESLFGHGLGLVAEGRYEEALTAFEGTLAVDPAHIDALNNYGCTLLALQRFHEAQAVFRRALALRPDYPPVLKNLGMTCRQLGQVGDALACFESAIRVAPDYLDAWVNRALLLRSQRRYEEALASYGRALGINSQDFDIWNGQGDAYAMLGRDREALACFERALQLKPGSTLALVNRGIVLEKVGRHAEACAAYDTVLASLPDHMEAWINKSHALMRLGKRAEALDAIQQAQKIEPDSAKANVDEALIRLSGGDLAEGLRKYEWRMLLDERAHAQRSIRRPLWMGKGEVRGRTVLLRPEQGLGDLLQFVRYAPLLADRGAKVIVQAPGNLLPLLAGLDARCRVVPVGDRLPDFDLHCSLLSLPLALGTTTRSIPRAVPYLSVPGDAANLWRKQLDRGKSRLVGVCWRGNPRYKGDHERSMALTSFSPLLSVPDITFVSLHDVLDEQERKMCDTLGVLHPGKDLKSTAEMVAACDLVISVDTAWAHWAGAIGKPVWILLSYVSHWVWFEDREDSPWYPTARILRQHRPGDWGGLVAAATKLLRKWKDSNVKARRG